MKSRSDLRSLPSVNALLRDFAQVDLPRAALVALIRRELAAIRRKKPKSIDVATRIGAAIDELLSARIQPVINGTGVIVHTNLGRSPLGSAVIESISRIGSSYNNIEFDLAGGSRGTRGAYVEHNLATLCGAEAATVVNNCAAALILVLKHFARESKREVIISRGELVQIGGGFRIPEILEASGATLREVGTTNRTTAGDYSRAINKNTAMILKVHRSNFFMDGFVESPDIGKLVEIARKARVPLVEDLGSGATFNTRSITPDAEHEPAPAELIRAGVDLVTFSGDKLLGGPQAGIIAGRAKLVGALKRDPFFRALRCDKLVLAAMQTTVDLHLRNEHDRIPIFAMLREPIDQLRVRAQQIIEKLSKQPINAKIVETKARIGGGSLPRTAIPSIAIALTSSDRSAQQLAAALRGGSPPVIGTIAGGALRIDLRTVFPSQDQTLLRRIEQAIQRN